MKKKVTPKKNVQKSYSTDEVKRYLGSLSEDFQGKISAVAEHTLGLREEMKRGFGEVHARLDSHTEMIGKLLLDVHDIKNEKVGHGDFSRLEKRVLKIENRLHGVRGK